MVGEPCAISEAVFLFAVTNAHVARSCPVIRTAGPVNKRRVIVRKESDWYRHPDQDDVVATPIGFAPKDARDFYLDYVPREWFVTPENFSMPPTTCVTYRLVVRMRRWTTNGNISLWAGRSAPAKKS